MKYLLNAIFIFLNRSKIFVISIAVTFVLAIIIIGWILPINLEVYEIFKANVLSYYNVAFCLEISVFEIFIKRLFTLALILVVVLLLSLNKYTIYLNFIIVIFRGFLLGIALKIFLLETLLVGFFTFLFLVFIESLFLVFSIALLISIIKYNQSNCEKTILLKSYLFCLAVSVIGVIIECLLILTLFRLLNY